MPEPENYEEKWGFMLPAICHEHCYNYRQRRIPVEDALAHACTILNLNRHVEEVFGKCSEAIRKLIEKWVANEEDYHHAHVPALANLAQELCDNPGNWHAILTAARRMFA